MNFTTTKENLLNAVVIAERLVGKKETLPVLSCVYLSVDEQLVIEANNLESKIRVHIPVEVKEKGAVAVPVAIFSQTIRSLSGGAISLKSGADGNVLITSKNTKTLIKSIPHDEFPVSQGKKKTTVTIEREKLVASLNAVVHSASPSMIRPELGSIYLSFKPDTLTCVATDSFRLSEKTVSLSSQETQDILLPLKHTQECLHVLQHVTDTEVGLGVDESEFVLKTGSVEFVSRVVDGTFPNYKAVIPGEFKVEATILKTDFSDVIKKAKLFSGPDQQIGFHVSPQKSEFSVTAQNQAVGEMSDTIDGVFKGEDIDISFHISYLQDSVTTIQNDSIVLKFAGAGRPLVIQGVSDESFVYLVMPLNK